MPIARLIRVSLFAIAAAAATASPGWLPAGQPAMAAPKVSGDAVQAARLAIKGDFIGASQAAARSRDPAAEKLVELFYLRDKPNEAGYQRIMAFLDTAPDWPLAEPLLKRAERSLYANKEPASLIIGHFNKRQPTTNEGALALARALLANGDRETARKFVQRAWFDPKLESSLEQAVSSEFGKLLSDGDHRMRLWKLVLAQETNAAIRAAKRLSGDHQKAAAVAQKLIRGEKGADKAYGGLSKGMRAEPAMQYALTRYHRRNKDYAKARAILAGVPGDAAAMIDPEAWWVERRIIARHSTGIKQRGQAAKAAYQIARNHGMRNGDGAIEGEFLAGWIALRYLKDSKTALAHFAKLGEIAGSRTEKARAHYWQGRALEAQGRKADARAQYRAASQYTTIYYGQLAREKIGLGNVPEEIPSGKASAAAAAKVSRDEAVRAFKMVAEAGGKQHLPMFLWSFANRFTTVDEMNAVAGIVWGEGGAYMSVRLAKAAASRNLDIDAWGYPVRALPDWKQVGRPVEKPLVFALSRQESEFNPVAGSQVGAQGLMQIMPGTAKLIAKQHGFKYREGMLTGDPALNVAMGAAHMGDLIHNFGGSYVLMLVAYNAGPRRAREWTEEFGDIRSGTVDPIDWVESIPFQETRGYVQKVMQNLHIYRSRLAPATVKPMTADLARGSRVDSINVATTSPAEPEPAGCAVAGSIAELLDACP